MDVVEKYMQGRRRGIRLEIKQISGNRVKLLTLKSKRESLARTYEEDGASHTAYCIRTIDVPMIEAAIDALEK